MSDKDQAIKSARFSVSCRETPADDASDMVKEIIAEQEALAKEPLSTEKKEEGNTKG